MDKPFYSLQHSVPFYALQHSVPFYALQHSVPFYALQHSVPFYALQHSVPFYALQHSVPFYALQHSVPFYALQHSVPFTVPTSTKLGGIAWRCSKANFTKISQEIWKLGIKTYWRPKGNYDRPWADFHKINSSCPQAFMTNTQIEFDKNPKNSTC